jgi:hypothetical protein
VTQSLPLIQALGKLSVVIATESFARTINAIRIKGKNTLWFEPLEAIYCTLISFLNTRLPQQKGIFFASDPQRHALDAG